MGYCVIGFGRIECAEFSKEQLLEIPEMMQKDEAFRNIEVFDGEIYFEMDGNKGIDYAPLDKIKEKMLAMGSHPFLIDVGEYMECGSNYYFDTEDVK